MQTIDEAAGRDAPVHEVEQVAWQSMLETVRPEAAAYIQVQDTEDWPPQIGYHGKRLRRLGEKRGRTYNGTLEKHLLFPILVTTMKTTHLILTASFALLSGPLASAADKAEKPSFEQYLRESAVPKEVIDRFLQGPSWAQYDPELGYVLGNYLPQDGMDHSATISTVQANGARTSFMYAGKNCRINTYGDSFTQCHQVSDGETWQEYLAGHLGEPIRNFGMGGYGVYQAYRRMVREEGTDHGAQYVILYIWGDDHVRSLLRCRHAVIFRWWNDQGGRAFHNNCWWSYLIPTA